MVRNGLTQMMAATASDAAKSTKIVEWLRCRQFEGENALTCVLAEPAQLASQQACPRLWAAVCAAPDQCAAPQRMFCITAPRHECDAQQAQSIIYSFGATLTASTGKHIHSQQYVSDAKTRCCVPSLQGLCHMPCSVSQLHWTKNQMGKST